MPTGPNIYSLYVYNKIDSVSLDFLDKLAREPNTVIMSCELDLGIQDVVDRCWQELQLMRIYTKRYLFAFFPPTAYYCFCTAMTRKSIADIVQQRRRPRFQRSPHRPLQVLDRRSLRPSPPDSQRDLQIRHGLGRQRTARPAACRAKSHCRRRRRGFYSCEIEKTFLFVTCFPKTFLLFLTQ